MIAPIRDVELALGNGRKMPAAEEVAHTVNDSVPIEHLTRCAAMYAAFPGTYCALPPAQKKATKSTKVAKKKAKTKRRVAMH